MTEIFEDIEDKYQDAVTEVAASFYITMLKYLMEYSKQYPNHIFFFDDDACDILIYREGKWDRRLNATYYDLHNKRLRHILEPLNDVINEYIAVSERIDLRIPSMKVKDGKGVNVP